MSAIYYNGVMLQLTNILDLRQHAVYSDDGSDYLYTHFFLDCECIWNPLATADRNTGAVPIVGTVEGVSPPIGGGGFTSVPNDLTIAGWLPIVSAVGFLPAISIGNLRQTLLKPRGLLIVAIGNDILLISPNRIDARVVPGINVNPTTLRAPVDAKTGPHPITADLIGFHGLKSIKMRFTIETWVNECSAAKFLLSNRWEVTQNVDSEHYLTTRTVKGKAVFRSDTLALLALASPAVFPSGAVPDDFRRALFIPEPAGFQRKDISVTQSQDGTTVDYQFTDEEQTYLLGSQSVVTKIEGTFTQGFRGIGASASVVGGLHRPHLDLSISIAPILIASIDLTVWGRSTATNLNLVDAAQSVAIFYGFDIGSRVGLGLQSIVRFAIERKRLEFSMSRTVPSVSMWTGGIGATQRNLVGAGAGITPLPDGYGPDKTFGPRAGVPRYPAGNGTRGFSLSSLVAAALNGPCRQPVTPTTDRRAINFSISA